MKSHFLYECVATIGNGPRATVYRARDLALKREVAIKELNAEALRDPQQLDRYWQEARFLANVEHDGVVQIFGLDQELGWTIMELAICALDVPVARQGLPAVMVRGILRQVLEGLDCLHQQGHVHGALKPANLLVTALGTIKLSDSMGLSTDAPTNTFAKYVAPEQLDPTFGVAGPASDLYCLGLIGYELLKGPGLMAIIPGVGPMATDPALGWRRFHMDRSIALPPAASAVPGLPEDVAHVIDRLLLRDVAQRYGSALEVLKDLADDPAPLVPGNDLLAGKESAAAASTNKQRVKPAVGTMSPSPKHAVAGGTLLPTLLPMLTPAQSIDYQRLQPAVETVREDSTRRHKTDSSKPLIRNPFFLYPVCALMAFVLVLLAVRFLPLSRTASELRTVQITIVPDDAQISIDGATVIASPDRIYRLAAGEHTFTFAAAGYTALTKVVTIAATGNVPDLSFQLTRVETPPTTEKTATTKSATTEKAMTPKPAPKPHRVVISSKPPGAEVTIGDKKQTTPAEFELLAGSYVCRLALADYKSIERQIVVSEDAEPAPLDLMLEPIRQPRRFALLVGLRQASPKLPIFRHAPGDLAELGRTLKLAGYGDADVRVLVQTPDGPPATRPTLENVRKGIDDLLNHRITGDTVLLALAGPMIQPTGSTSSYFCPISADATRADTLLALEQLFAQLASCRATSKIVLLDGNRTSTNDIVFTPAKPEKLVPAGVSAIVASANGAPGVVHAEERHGLFWHGVLHGLRGASGSPGKITADELADYLADHFKKHVQRFPQSPSPPPLAKVIANVNPSEPTIAVPNLALLALENGISQRERGVAAREKKDAAAAQEAFTEAEKSLDSAIDQSGGMVEAFLERAIVRFHLERYDAMIADCEAAKKLAPETAAVYDLLADGQVEKAGIPPKPRQALVNAVEDYTAAVRLDPDYAPVYGSRGATYARLKDDVSAVKDYNDAIERSPQPDATYHENCARAQLRLNQAEDARDNFSAAIRLNKNEPNLYLGRAEALEKLNRLEEAKRDRNTAKQLREKQKRP